MNNKTVPGGRHLTWLLGGGLSLLTLFVIAVAVGSLSQDSGVAPSPSEPTGGAGVPSYAPSDSPTTTTTSRAPEISFTVTTTLAENGLEERTTVYFDGENLGSLFVNQSEPTDELIITADEAGEYSYELVVQYIYVDDAGETQNADLIGTGTIYIDDGSILNVFFDSGSALLRE